MPCGHEHLAVGDDRGRLSGRQFGFPGQIGVGSEDDGERTHLRDAGPVRSAESRPVRCGRDARGAEQRQGYPAKHHMLQRHRDYIPSPWRSCVSKRGGRAAYVRLCVHEPRPIGADENTNVKGDLCDPLGLRACPAEETALPPRVTCRWAIIVRPPSSPPRRDGTAVITMIFGTRKQFGPREPEAPCTVLVNGGAVTREKSVAPPATSKEPRHTLLGLLRYNLHFRLPLHGASEARKCKGNGPFSD